jgi:hypothetical protein
LTKRWYEVNITDYLRKIKMKKLEEETNNRINAVIRENEKLDRMFRIQPETWSKRFTYVPLEL